MNAPVNIEPQTLTRRAPMGGAETWDEKSRTFRAVVATATPVLRRGYDGDYLEVLDVAGVELAGSVPLLNAHRTGQIGDVIGKVERIERMGDTLEAVIRLSGRADLEGLARDIAEGVVDAVSAGYIVHDWLDETAEDGTRTKTATRWTLIEVSAVPVPADPSARIRSKQTMTTTPETTTPAPQPRLRADRTATDLELRGIASVANLDTDWVAEQREAGVTLGQARAAAIDALAERQNRTMPRTISHYADEHVGGVGPDLRDPATRSAAMGEALAVRAMPDVQLSPAARQFVGLTLPELARESLRWSGVDVRGMSSGQAVTRALGGLHSTSDFANALASAAFAVLRKAYENAPSGLKPLARRMELSDFRARSVVGLSGFSALEKVNEHGEFKRGTIHDSGESIKLESFGRIFGVTRQVIVNDDLGWLTDLPKKLAVAAAQFEAQKLANLLMSNPVMGDGKALFHADHGNLAPAGAAPSETALSAARLAMRTQRDEAQQLLGLAPRFLVVGPELETDAEKLMAAITPAATDDAQPIRLGVVIEPRLSGKAWYVAADPAVVDGLAYAHLQSEPGPQIEHRVGFDVDGVEFRVRLDFGAAFLDWRPWFRNPGQ
jgi:hypothetical protein